MVVKMCSFRSAVAAAFCVSSLPMVLLPTGMLCRPRHNKVRTFQTFCIICLLPQVLLQVSPKKFPICYFQSLSLHEEAENMEDTTFHKPQPTFSPRGTISSEPLQSRHGINMYEANPSFSPNKNEEAPPGYSVDTRPSSAQDPAGTTNPYPPAKSTFQNSNSNVHLKPRRDPESGMVAKEPACHCCRALFFCVAVTGLCVGLVVC